MLKLSSKEVVIFAPLYRRIPVDGWGGVEKIVVERARSLRRLGYRVQLVANSTDDSLADSVVSPDTIFSYPGDKARLITSLVTGKWTRYISIFTSLRRDIWEAPILSDASAIDPFNNFILTKEMENDRVLFYLHGNYYFIYQNWRKLFLVPDMLFRPSWKLNLGALNLRMNELLLRKGIRSHYMPNGTDFPDRDKIIQNPEEFLLFVGTINPLKAPHLAIRLARKLGLPLKIIGRITDVSYFRNMVKPFLNNVTEYLGEVDRRTLIETMRRSRALLFTSTWDEPQGIVVIEAQSYGVPVLALNLPFYSGIYEMIENYETGLIGTIDELCAKSGEIFNINRDSIYIRSKSKWSWESVLKNHHMAVIEKMEENISTTSS